MIFLAKEREREREGERKREREGEREREKEREEGRRARETKDSNIRNLKFWVVTVIRENPGIQHFLEHENIHTFAKVIYQKYIYCTLLENLPDNANVMKFSTISRYLTKLYVT